MLAHFVRSLLTLAFELIGNLAQTIALATRLVELLRLLIEQRLLLRRFFFERSDLRARVVDALHDVSKIRLRLIEERAKPLDVRGQSGDFLADIRRARCARRVMRPRLRQLRFMSGKRAR